MFKKQKQNCSHKHTLIKTIRLIKPEPSLMLFHSRYQQSHFLVACDIFPATNTSYHSWVASYLGSCLVAFFQTLIHRQTLKVRICIWEGAQDFFFSDIGSPHFTEYFLAPSFCLPTEEQTENVASRHIGILLGCWWKGRLWVFALRTTLFIENPVGKQP